MQTSKSELRIGVILNYINMGIGNLIPILYTPIMLAILGQQEYGLYKLSSSVTSYLGLMSLGLGSAVTRYLIKSRTQEGEEAESRMLGMFLVIFRIIAVMSLVFGIVLTLCLGYWYGNSLTPEELRKMQILVFIMVVNMGLSFSMAPYMSIVTAREKYIFYQCMNIVLTCIGPLLNLVALFLGYASIGMATATLALAIVVRVIYYYYIRCRLGIFPKYSQLPFTYLREILFFSFWIFVGSIVEQLYNATDTLMIGAIPRLATTGVAVYSVGCILNSIILSLTTGLSATLVPRTNKMVFEGASNKQLTDFSILVGRLQGYIVSLLIIGFILFGRPFIHFYVGDSYQDAYWVALFIIIPNIIPLAQSVCLSIVVAKNQHKFRSLTYLGIALLNVIGTWIALQHWGIKGAALVTGLALIVGNGIIMNWFYWKRTGLEIFRFWKQVGKVFTAPFILGCITYFIVQQIDLLNIWVFLLCCILFASVTFYAQWQFTMNEYERQLVAIPIKKLKKSLSI